MRRRGHLVDAMALLKVVVSDLMDFLSLLLPELDCLAAVKSV